MKWNKAFEGHPSSQYLQRFSFYSVNGIQSEVNAVISVIRL